MSHTNNALTKTSNRDYGVQYREYQLHENEPKEKDYYDLLEAELDDGLVRDTYWERRSLRRDARRLRYAI